jgi:ribokinase
MPRALTFGSVNIDHVYGVPHFVRPGETLSSLSYRRFAGGKGFNQSVALARAGAAVSHAGCIGADGAWLRDLLAEEKVEVTHLRTVASATGHAIIQVVPEGQNSIVLHGGANQALTSDHIAAALAGFGPGDALLLQNETNALPALLRAGRERGLTVCFNPAPVSPEVRDYPLDAVDLFILNEIEAEQLSGEADPGRQLQAMRRRHPAAAVVLTLGPQGACADDGAGVVQAPAPRVRAVDTTAAGDCFIGYFLAERLRGAPLEQALATACAAAAISVTRPGAAASIPRRDEVEAAAGTYSGAGRGP